MDSKEIRSLKFEIDFLKTEISVLKEYSDDDIIKEIIKKREKDKNERNFNDPNHLHFANYSGINEELTFKKIEYKKRIFEAEAELKQLKKKKKKLKIETNLSVTQSKINIDAVPFKIGLLFAKGQIYRKNLKQDFKYYYLENGNEKEFPNPSQLSKYLNLSRQYIDESFKDLSTNHNIFKSFKTMKNVHDYCTEKQIQMSEDFIQKYNSLNDSKS